MGGQGPRPPPLNSGPDHNSSIVTLMGKRLQPARFRNLYGGLQLRETMAAYGGLRRRLRGLGTSLLDTRRGYGNDNVYTCKR